MIDERVPPLVEASELGNARHGGEIQYAEDQLRGQQMEGIRRGVCGHVFLVGTCRRFLYQNVETKVFPERVIGCTC